MNVHDLIFFLIKQGGPYYVTRLAYTTISSTNYVEYIGISPRGSATSTAIWQVFKLTYTATDVVLIQTSLKEQIWDDRASLSYA